MLNSIPNDQNIQRQLERLAAQRYLYSKAKFVLSIQLLLTVPITIIWSIIVAVFPEFKIWSAFYGLTISLLDASVFSSFQKSLRQQAAKIQELFDCEVLHLEWHSLKVGSRPDAESINELSHKFKHTAPDFVTLKNWYPQVVGQLPLYLARLVCQRSNCWWDSKLRRRLSRLIIALLFSVAILVFAIGLFGGITLEKFVLAIFAPIFPVFLWGIREYKTQREAADTLDRLKSHIENLWENAIKNNSTSLQIQQEARNLQDEIYERRRNNPLIFDWIYKRLRSKYEEQMNKGADELVKEALQRVKNAA